MDGYTVWKIYRAVSFHMLQLRYDIFEHNGSTVNSELERYLKVKEYKYFEFLGNQFKRPLEAVQFFVANIAYTGDAYTIFESGEAWENYQTWMKNKESLTKTILDEIDLLVLPKDLFGKPPRLLVGILNGKIHPETAVAINRVIQFTDVWLKESYLGAGKLPIIIKKMDRFVKCDMEAITTKIGQLDVVK